MFYPCFDLIMALIMFLFGLAFYHSNGKAANLLTGYNMRSAEERKRYNEKEMCQCYGKRMMVMVIPFLGGTVIDLIQTGIGCLLAWAVWVVLLVLLMVKRTKLEKAK